MLQQTRVEAVVPYYERFLARFPSIDALATADLEDVMREWAGLGYYARARNLKRAAELMARDHDSSVPRDLEALNALPGVGRYTAGAVRSIAFREPAAIVDGNVRRVLARLLGEKTPSQKALWLWAGQLVPDVRPDVFNQALMELGATLCTPRSPRCDECPLARDCAALQLGSVDTFPAPAKRATVREVRALAAVVLRPRPRPAVLMSRRPERGLLGGLWELPSLEGDDLAALIGQIEERSGLRTADPEELGSVQHSFTHRALTLRLVRLQRRGGQLRRSAEVRWCTADDLADLPLSVLMKKSLRAAGIP